MEKFYGGTEVKAGLKKSEIGVNRGEREFKRGGG